LRSRAERERTDGTSRAHNAMVWNRHR